MFMFLQKTEYIIYMVCKNKFLLKSFDFMIILIVFIGQLFAMLGHDYLMTYPISLGLIFICFKRDYDKKITNYELLN